MTLECVLDFVSEIALVTKKFGVIVGIPEIDVCSTFL